MNNWSQETMNNWSQETMNKGKMFLLAFAGVGVLLVLLTACTSNKKVIRDLQRPIPDRFFTQEDIEKAGGNYRLTAEGVGDVFVKEIRAPDTPGEACMVDKQSLSDQVRDFARAGIKHTWLRMQIFDVPDIGRVCFLTDGGCYILIDRFAAPEG